MRKTKRESQGRFITIQSATERYNFCRNKIVSIAKSANAFCKVGRSARIDSERLDHFFEEMLTKQE